MKMAEANRQNPDHVERTVKVLGAAGFIVKFTDGQLSVIETEESEARSRRTSCPGVWS